MKTIEIDFEWSTLPEGEGDRYEETVFIQVPDVLSDADICLSVEFAGRSHAAEKAYDIDTQNWEWWDLSHEIPDYLQFMPMGLERLRELAATVAKPMYTLGQVVELSPEGQDPFYPGTRGLIVAIHAYNDAEHPYTSYTVQIADDPPGEHNDHFNGYVYEGPWVVSVFEDQVVQGLS